MIPKHLWRSTGTPTASIQNKVIGTGIQGKLNVLLDMVGAELEAYGYAAGKLSDTVGKVLEIGYGRKILERWR